MNALRCRSLNRLYHLGGTISVLPTDSTAATVSMHGHQARLLSYGSLPTVEPNVAAPTGSDPKLVQVLLNPYTQKLKRPHKPPHYLQPSGPNQLKQKGQLSQYMKDKRHYDKMELAAFQVLMMGDSTNHWGQTGKKSVPVALNPNWVEGT